MVDYRKWCMDVFNCIDEMYAEGKTQDEIYFIVSKKFGASELTVKKRVDLLVRLANREDN